MVKEKKRDGIYSIADLWFAIQSNPQDREKLVEQHKVFDKKKSCFFSQLSVDGKSNFAQLSIPLRKLAIDIAVDEQ